MTIIAAQAASLSGVVRLRMSNGKPLCSWPMWDWTVDTHVCQICNMETHMNPNLSCQVSKIVCISKVQNSSDFKTGDTIALQTSSDVGRGVGNGNSQASFRTIVGVYPFLKKSRNWEAGPL